MGQILPKWMTAENLLYDQKLPKNVENFFIHIRLFCIKKFATPLKIENKKRSFPKVSSTLEKPLLQT